MCALEILAAFENVLVKYLFVLMKGKVRCKIHWLVSLYSRMNHQFPLFYSDIGGFFLISLRQLFISTFAIIVYFIVLNIKINSLISTLRYTVVLGISSNSKTNSSNIEGPIIEDNDGRGHSSITAQAKWSRGLQGWIFCSFNGSQVSHKCSNGLDTRSVHWALFDVPQTIKQSLTGVCGLMVQTILLSISDVPMLGLTLSRKGIFH